MALKDIVGTIAHEAVSTAASVVRHPIGTAARATGLVRDTAGAGLGLVLGRASGDTAPAASAPAPAAPAPAAPDPTPAPAAEKPEPAEDPRDHIPGPDLAAFPPPAPEDLPEPIVIVAE